MKKIIKAALPAILLTLFFIAGAWGHETWIEEKNEQVAVLTGHHGEPEPYEPERVKKITGYTENMWKVNLELVRKDKKTVAHADETFVAFTAFLDNRYWINSDRGWKNTRNKKDLKVIEEGRSYKYAKHISGWNDKLAEPLNQRFEIVPMENPTTKEKGDKLPVRVYFEGKPAANIRLSKSSSLAEGTHGLTETTGNGPFEVTTGPPGTQMIIAKYVLPVEDKQVVWFAAALTFDTTKK